MQTNALKDFSKAFATCDRGATAIEYALLASLLGVVILGAVTALGTSLEQSFDNTTNAID